MGLKDEDLDLLPPCPTQEAQGGDLVICTPPVSQRATPCLQPDPPQRLSSGTKLPAEGAMSPVKSSQAAKLEASKEEEEEEEDWLSHVLSQKKSQGLARAERTGAYKTIAGPAPSGRYGLGLLCEWRERARTISFATLSLEHSRERTGHPVFELGPCPQSPQAGRETQCAHWCFCHPS